MSDPRKTTAAQWDDVWRGTQVPVRPGRINPSVISMRRLLLGALPENAKSVFELGCAPGAWLADLQLRTGLEVSGCDLSPEGIVWTRRNFEALGVRGEVYEADVFKLNPDEHGAHDLVYSFGLVEHFSDTRAILEAHAAVTRPGGSIVVSVPNLQGLSGKPYYRADPNVEKTHEVMTAERLEEAARAAGLAPIHVGYGGPFSAYVLLDRMHGRARRVLTYGACTLAAALSYPLRARRVSGQVRLIARKPSD